MILVLASVRTLHLASLMATWGACFYLVLLKHRVGVDVPARVIRAAVMSAAALALVTAILWLCLVTGQMTGDWNLVHDPSAIAAVAGGTRFGHIWLARIGGLILLWLLSLFEREPRGAFAFFAALLLASLGLTSHAAANGEALGALNDAIHLLTAGFWLGGLLVLALLAARHSREPDRLVAPFRLFSRWGLFAVAILVITGTVNAASILGLSDLSPGNAYADLLGVKIALALAMIAYAAVNRSQLLPALENSDGGVVARLRHNVAAELVLGVLVVAVVGYLGLISPS